YIFCLCHGIRLCFLFSFNVTATTAIYTLSLYDALPILGGGHVVAWRLVVGLSGPPVHDRQCVGGVDVEEEGNDQADPQQPQHHVLRDDGGEEAAERLRIDVHVRDPVHVREEHLEVPEHVGDREADDDDSGHRHHPLLADRRPVELHRERRLLGSLARG